MNSNALLRCAIAIALLVWCPSLTVHAEMPTGRCAPWIGLVDKRVPFSARGESVEELPEKLFIEGIECLLSLEGNRGESRFEGVTRPDVSELTIPAPVEVAALYLISAIYSGYWDHTSEVALYRRDLVRDNGPESCRIAYESYRLWFLQIRKQGLRGAKANKLEPLIGADVHWAPISLESRRYSFHDVVSLPR